MTYETDIVNESSYHDINSKFSRWYCEPCYINNDQLVNLCKELTENQDGRGSINLEFFIKARQFSNEIYAIAIFQINNILTENHENNQIDEYPLSIDDIAYADIADRHDDEKEAVPYRDYEIDDSLFNRLCLFDQLQIKLKKINNINKLKPLQNNELSFPKKLFTRLKSSIPLRICTSIPKEVGDRYVFTFSDDKEKDFILKNVKDFALRTQFTHFIALPIAPNFPEWTNSMKAILARWGVDIRQTINRTHITIALFVIKDDEELNLVNEIATEALREIEWPEVCTLKTPKLGYFGSSKNATILFIEPEKNDFVEALSKFIAAFVSKMNDHGFSYIEEDSKALHITIIRPNFVTNRRTFDPTKYVSDFGEDELPVLNIQELRLVQRFVYDEDDFYKTHFRYPVPKIDQNDSINKEENENKEKNRNNEVNIDNSKSCNIEENS